MVEVVGQGNQGSQALEANEQEEDEGQEPTLLRGEVLRSWSGH